MGLGSTSLGCSQVLPLLVGATRAGSTGEHLSVQASLRLFWGSSGSFSAFPAQRGEQLVPSFFPVLAFIPLSPYHTTHGVDTDLYMWKAPQ